ncbi:MAG: 2-C-methyl-D-erythritol 2,4-cyclodiphosphate synthase [Candidatus Gastranaerophilales bacterium]|nr:2-C-methyl-D-erythritol 2,4-cyclodiphosphate synthase [Candidatus Gastranaerophilales bacterium]
MQYRIGQGFDLHKLVEGRKFILGGIEIPYEKGLFGHSDADALCHSIIDALFGALALGDIGTHFPDNDPKYKGADSILLLKEAYGLVKKEGYLINNLDNTIMAQAPKMKPYIPLIQEKLAVVLGVDKNQISIKAKTMEGVDAVGEKRAVSTQSIVLLVKD